MFCATRRGTARTLVVLGLLVLGACATGGTCTLHRVADLPMAAGSPVSVAQVRINGQDAMMVLDTGAQGVFLTPRGARRLGLRENPRVRGRAAGIGGSVEAVGATLDQLSLGASEMRGVPASVVNQELPAAGAVSVDGLLGTTVLDHYDLALDMAARRATLYAGAACAASPPRWSGVQRIAARSLNGVFVIPVKLDGRSFEAMIDSGSQSNVLFTDTTGIAFALRHRLPGGRLRGLGPNFAHAFQVRFAHLTVGDETLREVPFVVTARRPGTPDIVLGQPFLAQHRVWFSAQRQAVFVAPG